MRGVRRINHGRARVTSPATTGTLAPVGETAGSTAGVSGGAASPQAIGVMPMAEVLVYPDPGQAGYATVAYSGLAPIYTADGAAVPGRPPGRWAQLRAAGRP